MVWLGIILALGSFSLVKIVPQLIVGTVQDDFSTFYLAGRMVVTNPSQIYSMSAMDDFVTMTNLDPRQAPYRIVEWAPGYAYPPFFTVLLRPLSTLPFKTASLIWVGLNILWLLLSLPLLLILAGGSKWKEGRWYLPIVGFFALILFSPAQEVLMLGQTTLLLLCLTSSTLVLLRSGNKKRDFLAGLLIGLASAIKIFPALLVVYLIIRRRWFAVMGAAVAFLIALLIGIVGVGGWQNGWSLTWQYFTVNLFGTFTTRFSYLQLGNQALSAFFIRILGKTSLSEFLGLGSSLVIFGITVWFLFRPKQTSSDSTKTSIELALVSILPLMVISWVPSNFCTLALIPIAVLISGYNDPKKAFSVQHLQTITIIYMLMTISSYEDWLSFPFFRYFPAGLIGILILWGLLIHKARTKPFARISAELPNP